MIIAAVEIKILIMVQVSQAKLEGGWKFGSRVHSIASSSPQVAPAELQMRLTEPMPREIIPLREGRAEHRFRL